MSAYAYPAVLTLHILTLAFFGGMVLMTDLRLLDLALRSYPVDDVLNNLRVPKRVGFALAAASGLLLFGARADRYSHNPWFWAKLVLLALVGFTHMVFRSRVKLAAALSLLLWTAVVCAGRGPATIKDIMHSVVDPTGDAVFKSVQQIADAHGIREKAPRTDAEWQEVRHHLMVLYDAPDVLATPGRLAAHPKDRSKNPAVENEPPEVQRLIDADRPNFIRRARKLRDAATLGIKAVDAKDKDGLFRAIDTIDKACESCHLHYWYPNDIRAQQAAKADGITD
jgi:hypothetical protein